MKTKYAKVLPKTEDEIENGGLYLQRVRCGKKQCKCARGEAHPAYYFFTRRNGKLIKIYVRKSDVEGISALSESASANRAQQRQTARSSGELLKRLRDSIREYETLVKLSK